MNERLKILVLHHLGDPRNWRTSMVEHELCLPTFAPDHDYLVHDAALPLPDFVRDIDFDGIVLTQTFLGRRRHPRIFRKLLDDYAFVARSPAFKIAMPQDDYECSALLDRWLTDWRVDRIYTVCSEHWDVLYPLNSQTDRLRLGFTAYLSDTMIDRWIAPKPLREREIDVSYRTMRMPAHIGRIGYEKWAIAGRFLEAARGRNLILDISVDPKDVIVGSRWGAFLENSKFVLGANSGSSMYDPTGEISERVIHYEVTHPGASFDEIEAACFPGIDGRYRFTAISPRNLECGLIGSAQILTRGTYSNLLEPGAHYIPMDADLRNAAEVFERMADVAAVERMVRDCKDALLSRSHLRYSGHVPHLLEQIAGALPPSRSAATARERALLDRYADFSRRVAPGMWRRMRMKERLLQAAVAMGARRIKRALFARTGS